MAQQNRRGKQMAIEIVKVSGSELWEKRHGDHKPMPVAMYLDPERGRAWCATHEMNQWSMKEHNRLWVSWSIPALTEVSANELMQSCAELFETISEGFEIAWDGNNHVGRYIKAAMEAIEQVREACDEDNFSDGDRVQCWDADNWFGGLGGWKAQAAELNITAKTTDEELDAIVEREEGEAEVDGTSVELYGTLRHLEWLRKKAIEEESEEDEDEDEDDLVVVDDA